MKTFKKQIKIIKYITSGTDVKAKTFSYNYQGLIS